MMQMLTLGIDIGGTNTAFGVVNEEGVILEQGEMPTKGYAQPEDYVTALYQSVQLTISQDYLSQVKGIGVGAPSANYYQGTIEHAPNMEWRGIIPIGRLIEEQFKLPVKVTNDANAAAMGEMMYGAARGMKDFIMVTLGTGVGSGFIANGNLIYGHDGFAGELGHVNAVRNGRACGCGRKGCLEAYTSATGVVKTAIEMLASDTQSLLHQHQSLDSKLIFDAALAGDTLAKDVFEYTGQILGQTLADAVAITSPEAIILFGGLAKAGELIFEPTRRAMEENLLNLYQGKIKLLASELKESDAAITGAAALIG
ncbi:MAG: ROK family protein [Chitinophagaceae bacterium]|nr:ROK family protein [Chitinophagaceae bacterium]